MTHRPTTRAREQRAVLRGLLALALLVALLTVVMVSEADASLSAQRATPRALVSPHAAFATPALPRSSAARVWWIATPPTSSTTAARAELVGSVLPELNESTASPHSSAHGPRAPPQ